MKRKKRKKLPPPTRNEIEKAVDEYLNQGGKITKLDFQNCTNSVNQFADLINMEVYAENSLP